MNFNSINYVGESLKLRFSPFYWEQRKLGDVFDVTMGQSPPGSTYNNHGNGYILVQGNADIKNGRIFPKTWTTCKKKTAKIGDILLSVRAPVGEVAKANYDVVLGRGMAGIEGNEFLYQLLNRLNQNRYWNRVATGSTFKSINSKDINNTKIFLTSAEEQESIGNLLKMVDRDFTLHQ